MTASRDAASKSRPRAALRVVFNFVAVYVHDLSGMFPTEISPNGRFWSRPAKQVLSILSSSMDRLVLSTKPQTLARIRA